MAESETLDRNVRAADIALKAERAKLEGEKADAKKRTSADQQELTKLSDERRATAGGMTPAGLQAYERIRKMRGNATAELVGGRCSACHVTQRPHFIQELKRGDKLMFCESCGRMLFYSPPQSFEQYAGAGKDSVLNAGRHGRRSHRRAATGVLMRTCALICPRATFA